MICPCVCVCVCVRVTYPFYVDDGATSTHETTKNQNLNSESPKSVIFKVPVRGHEWGCPCDIPSARRVENTQGLEGRLVGDAPDGDKRKFNDLTSAWTMTGCCLWRCSSPRAACRAHASLSSQGVMQAPESMFCRDQLPDHHMTTTTYNTYTLQNLYNKPWGT